jgi:capsular exopolysaccharide synthesis family protein
MNFFFDALRREAGENVDTKEPVEPVVTEKRTTAAAVTAPASFAVASAPVLSAAAKPAKRTATLRGTPEKLVAKLKPPVLDSSIIAMEQCRLLRNRVRESLRAKRARSVMLTSATAGEGKTLLSINLAYTLSQLENTRVLLIDGDLRRPSVETTLRIADAPGLTEYLNGHIELDEAVQQLTPTLDVIAARPTEHSSDLVHSPLMEKLIAHAGAKYDIVVIDGPPLFPIVDAQVLGAHADAVLLVVRAEHTPYDLAAQCERVESIRGKIMGAVLNCVTRLPHEQYGKYGYGARSYTVKGR